MASPWFFYHAGEDFSREWQLSLCDERSKVEREQKPMFMTVLDITGQLEGGDRSKIRYRGPLYFDFDMDTDDSDALAVVCSTFRVWLEKFSSKYDFDFDQAFIYLSGGKGFHVEIPMECFVPKVASAGYLNLAFAYREVAKTAMVESLDLSVYSARKGRMWRQPNIKRKNGKFKVQVPFSVAKDITPQKYQEMVAGPQTIFLPKAPSIFPKLALAFDNASRKVQDQLRAKKKRGAELKGILSTWKGSGKTPPPIQSMMDGDCRDGIGFQQIALQLSIWAATMELGADKFVEACTGLIEKHESDSYRYATKERRIRELRRMYEYMGEDDTYSFDPAPIAACLPPGTDVSCLGGDAGESSQAEVVRKEALAQDDPAAAILEAAQMGVRRGIRMNDSGIFVEKGGDGSVFLSRGYFTQIQAYRHYERVGRETIPRFLGYEADLMDGEQCLGRVMLNAETFATGASLRKYLLAYQVVYQGNDAETLGLVDIIAQKGRAMPTMYAYPREGMFIMNHPEDEDRIVRVYLTKDTFVTDQPDDEKKFSLSYRPEQALSRYNIDIHKAPKLKADDATVIAALFRYNTPRVVLDTLGWFLAAHYRSFYLHLRQQFPILQVYGEAGSGKSQTALMLSRLHWFHREPTLKSAVSMTAFAVDHAASSTTSAPFMIDEFKPREMVKSVRGRYEKLKDVLKASYVGSEVGDRGTLNKSLDTPLTTVSNRATAPIVFIGEAAEAETAIQERCVTVALSQQNQNPARTQAFEMLQEHTQVVSALGRLFMEFGFRINLDSMNRELTEIQKEIRAAAPVDGRGQSRMPARLVYNRAVILQTMRALKAVLRTVFGARFDADVDSLVNVAYDDIRASDSRLTSVSETAKVISAIAKLSRKVDTPWEVRRGKDFILGEGWVEIRVEECYDRYRAFCTTVGETILFDNMTAFRAALDQFGPVRDRYCVSSPLREEGSNELILRLDTRMLLNEGCTTFRT